LFGDIGRDSLHFRCIDESTLYPYRFATAQEKHVASSDKLVSSRAVQNRTGVDHGAYFKGHSCREVCLDGTRNDVGGRALGSDDHVNSHGPGQLCDAGDRQFYFFSGRHNQISELVDDDYDVRHETMPVFRIELAVFEFGIILFDITGTGFFQQVVARVHFTAEAFQRGHHLLYVRNDRLVISVGNLRQEMVFDG